MKKTSAFLIGCAIICAVLFILLWQFKLGREEIPPAFTLMDYKVSSTDGNVINLIILNTIGTKVTLNSVKVMFSGSTCSYSVGSDLRVGQSMSITIPKSGECSDITLPNQGERFQADITFNYTNINSGLTHLSTAECHGGVE